MAYEHGERAGNQGDVIKHVALVALLDTVLSRRASAPWIDEFRFADLYAGNGASNLKGGGAWRDGIEAVARSVAPKNPHVLAWKASYVADEPSAGDSYPGSSLIARDVILRHRQKPRLAAWDVHPATLGNLWTIFGSGDDHVVHDGKARRRASTIPTRIYCERPFPQDVKLLPDALRERANHPDVRDADFLLLDPPDADPGADHCLHLVEEVRQKQAGKAFLVWLPVMAAKTTAWDWSRANQAAHARAMKMNLSATVVLWRAGRSQGMFGCQLLYPFSKGSAERDALEQAVEDVVRILGWNITANLAQQAGGVVAVPTGPCPSVAHVP